MRIRAWEVISMRKRHVFVSLSVLLVVLAVGLYPKNPSDVVALAIAENTGYCYAWYRDGTASFGVSDDLARHQGLYRYVCPPGKSPSDIVGIAMRDFYPPGQGLRGVTGMRKQHQTLAFYRDGTYSIGESNNLGKIQGCRPYSLPNGKRPTDIVGVAAPKDQFSLFVLVWYRDGTVSGGAPSDLDNWRSLYQYVLPMGKTTADIIDMGIAPNTGYVYTWYRDGTVSAGISDHLDRHRACYPYRLPN